MKGRKTKYNPEIVQKICDLISEDTYTIPEICELVGISEGTFHLWKSGKIEFFEAIKKAEETQLKNLTRMAKNSMVRLINGYDYEEKKTVNKNVKTGKDENGEETFKLIKVEETITTRHVQPNPTIVIFTMKNGDPKNFKDRHETDLTSQGEKLGLNVVVMSESCRKELDKLANNNEGN